MDFFDATSPQDAAGTVADVLCFLGASLCWPAPGKELLLNERSVTGLCFILNACQNTLDKLQSPNG